MTTTTTESQTAKPKKIPDLYVFVDPGKEQQGGKPAGAVFAHKKGHGFTILIDGKRYLAYPPKKKAQPAQGAGA